MTAPVSFRYLFIAALKAGAVAAFVNTVLFLVGSAIHLLPASVLLPNVNQPLRLQAVIVSSLFPPFIAALLVYFLLKYTLKPKLIFNTIAALLFVLSFILPFGIQQVPIGMAMLLNLMHVVVAANIIIFFKTLKN